jgi:hypothetical protein
MTMTMTMAVSLVIDIVLINLAGERRMLAAAAQLMRCRMQDDALCQKKKIVRKNIRI